MKNRITISLPDELLERLRKEAGDHHCTCSQEIETILNNAYHTTFTSTPKRTPAPLPVIPETLRYHNLNINELYSLYIGGTFPMPDFEVLVATPASTSKIVIYKPAAKNPLTHGQVSVHLMIKDVLARIYPTRKVVLPEDIYLLLMQIHTEFPRYKKYTSEFQASLQRIRYAGNDAYAISSLTDYEYNLRTAVHAFGHGSDKEIRLIYSEIERMYPQVRYYFTPSGRGYCMPESEPKPENKFTTSSSTT